MQIPFSGRWDYRCFKKGCSLFHIQYDSQAQHVPCDWSRRAQNPPQALPAGRPIEEDKKPSGRRLLVTLAETMTVTTNSFPRAPGFPPYRRPGTHPAALIVSHAASRTAATMLNAMANAPHSNAPSSSK